MATVSVSIPRARGMSLRDLLMDTVRSPLAQALLLAAVVGTLLHTLAPSLGLRETYRGSVLPSAPTPEFALTDQFGQRVTSESLAGGAVVLTFIYTNCPDTCLITTANMAQAVRLLGTDAKTARYVAITVDPSRDDPAALRAYADRFGLADKWSFLTGPVDEINRVVAAFHAQPVSEAAVRAVASVEGHEGHGVPAVPPGEVVHPSFVVLIDAEGNQRFAYGPDFDPKDLAHDIELLQRDLGGPNVPFPLY